MSRRAIRLTLAAVLSIGVTAPVGADEPEVTIVIDRFGSYSSDGVAIITGTVICDPELGVLGADVYVRQRVGGRYTDGSGIRGFTDGFGLSENMVCDGTVHEWVGGALSRDVDREGNFVYKAGPAHVSVDTSAFGGEGFAERDVILRPSH